MLSGEAEGFDLVLAVVNPSPAIRAEFGAGVISLRLSGTVAIAAFRSASISRLWEADQFDS